MLISKFTLEPVIVAASAAVAADYNDDDVVAVNEIPFP